VHRGNVDAVLSSAQVCRIVGCSYRQLDYLTRLDVIQGMNRGSGSRRHWPLYVVVRLAIARFMTDVVPSVNDVLTPFPAMAQAALDESLDNPPRRGYAVLVSDPPKMMWAGTWADLRQVVEEEGAALIVRYDLDDLVGADIDLSELPITA
jgi:hypothetical protein